MGKSKKTRWRTFEIGGSQDETQTNHDVKVNEADSESHAPVTSQKYSQILGDHHTNSSTQSFSKNLSSHHTYRSRGYNNKENFYNQRSGGRIGAQRSWQRGGNYRTSIVNGKEKKPNENENTGSNDAKVDSTTEQIKFNEDEYTRITTPRQDVLFKKGYLSRMNNKTAINLSATANSTESTAASSTITTSDPDSSVSTLSPATTPSMDYGQMDSMEYAPMYYPGYYDENGMLVIPMYNGYNYYPPSSAATSPVFLMPYPCQYDPFFMTPSTLQPVDGEENTEDKTDSDGAKENNQHAENQNGARSTSSSEDGVSSNHDEEIKEEEKEFTEVNGTEVEANDNTPNDISSVNQKPNFPVYSNELNGYMYPAYPNGYYNNFYYYNGAPGSRPPKIRRRKRFLNSRNSHHQQARSAETTTDYSDDDNTTYTKRFNPRYQNGWMHHNCYNQYNGKFHRVQVDQNANQTSHEFHLNVDVEEFYPRVQSPKDEPDSKVNYDEKSKLKVEAPKTTTTTTKVSCQTKTNASRISKKEIIEGIKLMEQQNIDLMATKYQATANSAQDDEWNIIKKGKKVKVVKDNKMESSSPSIRDDKKDKVEETKIEPKLEMVAILEPVKKSIPAPMKLKKSKSKNKKKKMHLPIKQNGFEIIEPEFTKSSCQVVDVDEISPELSEEETAVEQAEIPTEIEVNILEVIENVVLNDQDEKLEPVVVTELEVICNQIEEEIAQIPDIIEERAPEIIDLPESHIKTIVEEDAVIDISDEDICCKINVPQKLASVTEVEPVAESKIQPEVQTKTEIPIQILPEKRLDPFQDMDYFNDRTNIAALERDLMENLRLLDEEIDLKTPIINPLYDFPITSAVRKWLQEKQSESFDSLFHVQNLKKLSELYEDDDEDDETESDISEKELKSETDSDYASDFHTKVNGGSPTCSTHAKGSTKCNKLIAKESFCALM